MQELVRADIFFAVSTAAVVVITIGLLVVFYYAVTLLKRARRIVDRTVGKVKDLSKLLDLFY